MPCPYFGENGYALRRIPILEPLGVLEKPGNNEPTRTVLGPASCLPLCVFEPVVNQKAIRATGGFSHRRDMNFKAHSLRKCHRGFLAYCYQSKHVLLRM